MSGESAVVGPVLLSFIFNSGSDKYYLTLDETRMMQQMLWTHLKNINRVMSPPLSSVMFGKKYLHYKNTDYNFARKIDILAASK